MQKIIEPFSIFLVVSSICFWTVEINYFNFSLPIIVFLNFIIFLFMGVKKFKIHKNHLFIIFLIFFSLILSSININCLGFQLKAVLSSIVYIFIIYTYSIYFTNIIIDLKKVLIISAHLSLFIIFLFVLFEIFFYDQFFSYRRFHNSGKYSGIFTEPSHLAISIFPGLISLSILVNGMKKNFYIIFYLLFFFIFSFSSTLVVYSVIIFSILFFSKHKISLISMIVSFIMIFLVLSLFLSYSAEFDERIQSLLTLLRGGFYGDLSLSSTIYLRGWNTAIYDLFSSYGIGLGFNGLGCHENYDDTLSIFLKQRGYEYFLLNIEDGSFLASKIISEFGLLSLFIFYFILKNLKKFYLLNLRTKDDYNKFCLIIFLFLLILLITRSVAYFASLWILVYVFLIQNHKHYEKYFNIK